MLGTNVHVKPVGTNVAKGRRGMRASLVRPVIFAILLGLAVVQGSRVAQGQQDYHFKFSGKVQDNAAAGLQNYAVRVHASPNYWWPIKTSVATNAMGECSLKSQQFTGMLGVAYDYTAVAKGNYSWSEAQLGNGFSKYTFSYSKGSARGRTISAAGEVAVAVPVITTSDNVNGAPFTGPSNRNRSAFYDPTYTFHPESSSSSGLLGHLFLTDDLGLGNADIPIEGINIYGDGTQSITDHMDTNGNPIVESIFDNHDATRRQ